MCAAVGSRNDNTNVHWRSAPNGMDKPTAGQRRGKVESVHISSGAAPPPLTITLQTPFFACFGHPGHPTHTKQLSSVKIREEKVDASGLGAVPSSRFRRKHGIFYNILAEVALYKSRTSKTAKCKAPFGSDSKNCAPAPLERVAHVSGRIAPKDPFVCSNVLITFAGWSEVCATLPREEPSIRKDVYGICISSRASCAGWWKSPSRRWTCVLQHYVYVLPGQPCSSTGVDSQRNCCGIYNNTEHRAQVLHPLFSTTALPAGTGVGGSVTAVAAILLTFG